MSNKNQFKYLLVFFIILIIILIPFFLFGKQMDTWIGQYLNSSLPKTLVVIMVGLLLTVDILLPIPSSFVSTSAGYLLGFTGGTIASLIGMSLSSIIGYQIGAHLGRPLVNKLIDPEEVSRIENIHQRFGDWSIIIARSIPVLAEASVLFAGINKMPLYRFLILSILSNLGISIIYAAVGAYSAIANSFLLAFIGAILLPGVIILISKKMINARKIRALGEKESRS